MDKFKRINISELINEYGDEFINSISLKNISSSKDLKLLLDKLEKANYVVTSFYEMMYNDYITIINSNCQVTPTCIEISTILKYKELATKIQKMYSYLLYLNTFDNPFKPVRK